MQQGTPKTSKPLREEGNQTEQFNHTNHAEGGESSDSTSDHLAQPLYKYQQDCQQKAHAQLISFICASVINHDITKVMGH
jgi:hypothetical protein